MVRRKGTTITRTFDTKVEAEEWAKATEGRIVAGLPAAPVRMSRNPDKMSDLFDRYAREISPTRAGCRWEQIRLARLARDFDMLPADCDPSVLAEWRDKRLETCSALTVNRELNLISAVFTRAIKEWGLKIAANPVQRIMRPKNPRERTRRVSEAERAAIIAQLGWDGASQPVTLQQWIAWTFDLALATMMRQGELLRMTWRYVHLDRKVVHLPKTKNGAPRDVPLSSRAIALFRLLTPGAPDQHVVPVDQGTFGKYFRTAVDVAGIDNLHFHDTRREAITQASKRLNIAELTAASGHRSVKSLMVYYAPDPTDIADKLG
jgi:integrase